MFIVAKLVVTAVLALVHVLIGKLRFLNENPAAWKSAGAGVGISYAFLVVLPKLARAQSVMESAVESGLYGFLVRHSYLVALLGFVIYYGMDALVENIQVLPIRPTLQPAIRFLVAFHAAGIAGYYFLVSYLMSELRARGYVGYVSLGLFATAMFLHYAAIDHSLRQRHSGLYDPVLRWILVAASVGGWTLAAVIEIPCTTLALLNSLFAGVLIVITLQEKTPWSNRVRLIWFVVGVAGYSMLLLFIEFLGIDAQ